MRARTAAAAVRKSAPATRKVPPLGGSSPHNMRKVVDLPAPFAPSKPNTSPLATEKLTLLHRIKIAETALQVVHFDDGFARIRRGMGGQHLADQRRGRLMLAGRFFPEQRDEAVFEARRHCRHFNAALTGQQNFGVGWHSVFHHHTDVVALDQRIQHPGACAMRFCRVRFSISFALTW